MNISLIVLKKKERHSCFLAFSQPRPLICEPRATRERLVSQSYVYLKTHNRVIKSPRNESLIESMYFHRRYHVSSCDQYAQLIYIYNDSYLDFEQFRWNEMKNFIWPCFLFEMKEVIEMYNYSFK